MDKDQTKPVTVACGCGKKLGDSAIIEEPRYGFFGDLTLLFGVTAAPKRIDYRCVKCGKVVHSASDAQTIKQFTH